jgi:hypothetical protein
MRPARLVLAVALILVGGVFTAQGSGLLKGSAMTGESLWLFIGLACVVIGLVLLFTTLRSSRS